MLIPFILLWLVLEPSAAINQGSISPLYRTYWPLFAGAILMVIIPVAFRFVPGQLSKLPDQQLLTRSKGVVILAVFLALLIVIVLLNSSYMLEVLPELRSIHQRVYLFTVLLYLLHIRLKGSRSNHFYEPFVISAIPLLLITVCYLILAALLKIETTDIRKLLAITMIVTYFNLGATMLSGERSLDNGLYLPDGYRLLGDGKSIRGTVGGLFIAVFLGVLTGLGLFIGLVVGLSTFLGDSTASFLKRRFGIDRGHPVVFLDQLDSIIYLLILNRYGELFGLGKNSILALVAATMLVQLSGNLILFQIGKKNVPW